jgi:hypothetical protein
MTRAHADQDRAVLRIVHTNCGPGEEDFDQELGNSGDNIVRELPVAQSGRSCREPQTARNRAKCRGKARRDQTV